jgi:hypothetical protein
MSSTYFFVYIINIIRLDIDFLNEYTMDLAINLDTVAEDSRQRVAYEARCPYASDS